MLTARARDARSDNVWRPWEGARGGAADRAEDGRRAVGPRRVPGRGQGAAARTSLGPRAIILPRATAAHLSPLTLAQAMGSRMIAEATVVGFFFAFWWRISHSQEKARYDAYYKALRAEKAEE